MNIPQVSTIECSCTKCGKYLGYETAVVKQKTHCKKCRNKFEEKAASEFGLRIVWVEKSKAVEVPEGLEITKAA